MKDGYTTSPQELLLDKAYLLDLSAPEMAVLIADLRSLGIGATEAGLVTDDQNKLTQRLRRKNNPLGSEINGTLILLSSGISRFLAKRFCVHRPRFENYIPDRTSGHSLYASEPVNVSRRKEEA